MGQILIRDNKDLECQDSVTWCRLTAKCNPSHEAIHDSYTDVSAHIQIPEQANPPDPLMSMTHLVDFVRFSIL